MTGRIKRKEIAAQALSQQSVSLSQEVVCQLCHRPIPKAQRDAHHLIPKSRGGAVTVVLHRLCHRQVHALFTETQLARHYSTMEALSTHPEIARFVDWIKDKPSDLNTTIRRSRDKGRL
ncbi:HNH endonuclease [Polynucleobacter antarcticus]|uniref:HNH endonuclease n=1 Tax=Polynucleobacter antarcticus TaxID=1743162 RepID=A0A6M9PQ28_9BURK|nr:HNH endonuclease [Polynucleobacter antarcticus]QKM62451.1 hypothetical protein DCO16_04860 [Polynucleobacter antarcticus]